MKRTILTLVAALCAWGVWSQTNEERLQQLLQDYPESLQSLLSADAAVQKAAFEVAVQPQALAEVQKIQDRSRAAFEAIVNPYSQETQQLFWDLTRYPNLITRLAREGRGSDAALQNVLRDYPQVIHARAKEASKYYYNLLVKMDDLQQRTNNEFNDLLQSYPRGTQESFRKLLDNPEVLTALSQDRRITEELAGLYNRDSNWTLRRFQELNRDMAQQNDTQLQSWKSQLDSDPEAINEFAESAQAYAREYGYDDEYYGEDWEEDHYYDDYRDNRRERVVVREYHYYHYPYWFGYPRWYRAPRWRPVPVWYDYGFVYRPGRPIVVVQMPSFYFVNWYFYRPWHHYRYARLSNCFVDYYYRYPRSYNSIVINVNTWKYRNRAVVSDDWLRDRNNRVERLREFGQFEEERRTYNRANESRAVSQRDYLEKNDSKFQRLRAVAPRNADRNTFPERERTIETPRRAETTTPPRTRAEAHERNRTLPERAESNPNPPRETPRRAEETIPPRTRDNVSPREVEPERTPRRSMPSEQSRRREVEPSTREPELQRREPTRREEPRTIERQPTREVPNRAPQERPRTQEPQRQRSEAPARTLERSRSNDNGASERSKAGSAKQQEAPRKRNGNE